MSVGMKVNRRAVKESVSFVVSVGLILALNIVSRHAPFWRRSFVLVVVVIAACTIVAIIAHVFAQQNVRLARLLYRGETVIARAVDRFGLREVVPLGWLSLFWLHALCRLSALGQTVDGPLVRAGDFTGIVERMRAGDCGGARQVARDLALHPSCITDRLWAILVLHDCVDAAGDAGRT